MDLLHNKKNLREKIIIITTTIIIIITIIIILQIKFNNKLNKHKIKILKNKKSLNLTVNLNSQL